jgi:peroxiredoxin
MFFGIVHVVFCNPIWEGFCVSARSSNDCLRKIAAGLQGQGFVVLAISDEEQDKVKPFITERKITYPVLLDPGRKVNDLFQVEGIPKSFVYDRDWKLVAQSIDMRTQKQFLQMLGEAGLQ